jgi:DNA end-binding protein Ku
MSARAPATVPAGQTTLPRSAKPALQSSIPAASEPPAPCPSPPPRSRPSWSGLLRLSLVTVPVKAYPAVSSSSTSHIHLLHAHCGQRIHYQKHCPQHGAVESDAIVRGYAYAPGQHVVVEPEELDQLRPARDKALLVEQFVPVDVIDPTFFAGRSLYLIPDGPAAQHPYGVLAEAIQRSGKAALGRVVFSNHRQLVLLRAVGRLLVLDVLHYPAQVRAAASWEAELALSMATPAERDLASQLIALASTPLEWARYRDSSAEELAALIEAKLAAQAPPAMADEPVAVLHLLDALKQSVAAARNGNTPEAAIKGRKARGRRAAG